MVSFSFISAKDGGALLEIHVQPKASKSAVCGEHHGRLKLRIAAPPIEGEANRECIAFLSKVFGVPKSEIRIVRGERGRSKTVSISRPPELIAQQLEKLLLKA